MADYWTDIIENFRKDPELRSWLDSDNVAANLGFIGADKLALWEKVVAYKGPNRRNVQRTADHKLILRTLRLIKTNYENYMRAPDFNEVTYKYQAIINDQETEKAFKNNEELYKDIQFLIHFFLMKTDNVRIKSENVVTNIVEMLKKKLGIEQVHAPNQVLDDNAITLPRICACFPTITCRMYHNGMGKLMISHEALGLKDGISKAVLTPFFTACIPPDFINPLLNAHLLFFIVHILIDDVIHEKDKAYKNLLDRFAFYKASYTTPATSLKIRKKFCAVLGLANQVQDNFIDEINDAIPSAEDRIRRLRPNDPNLNLVIDNLKKLKHI